MNTNIELQLNTKNAVNQFYALKNFLNLLPCLLSNVIHHLIREYQPRRVRRVDLLRFNASTLSLGTIHHQLLHSERSSKIIDTK